jgi:tetratricopeptide (TPR) repeat protein
MKNYAYLIVLSTLLTRPGAAADDDASLLKDSIKSTKQSIARETLDALYHDALDYYHDGRYEDSLQLLDKIYSIDPHYEDVGRLRETIRRRLQSTQNESTLSSVRDWMKKGGKAEESGQRVLAITYWKQALAVDPAYAPAQRKIDETNRILAKREFETGYIHYHHAELDDALDSWSNAIALDPTYKEKGLLLLMSKVELQVRRNQISRLAAQGFDQYQQGQLESALESYQELNALEPRNEEARRMIAKIKIQIGKTALDAAKSALTNHNYDEAITQSKKAIQYGYEMSRATAIKTEAEHAIQLAKQPKPKKVIKEAPAAIVASTASAPSQEAAPPPPAQPVNPEEAMERYRQGMAAMRKKDFHLALDELDAASKLDPTNERIYMARERARQSWGAANSTATAP